MASFQIISSVVSDNPATGFTKTLITSGIAPVSPGSKAAVAARLDASGAILLLDSLQRPTTDVSVAVTAYYEAALTGYRGRVWADLETVYDAMLTLINLQKNYSKAELREQVDVLERNGVINVEVTDRAGLDLDSGQMDTLLNSVTDKLIDMLFDSTQGLSALPSPDAAPKLEGREKRSFFAEVFGGHEQPKYVTDNQYTVRERKDIRKGTFDLTFTRNTTIKVPYNTAGNMQGFYDEFKEDESVFRIVNLNSEVFERRPIFFMLDGELRDVFGVLVNSVSIEFVKKYGAGRSDFADDAVLTYKDVVTDSIFQRELNYPRLGEMSADKFRAYEYRLRWSFVGGASASIPADPEEFISATDSTQALAPPGELIAVEVYANRTLMEERNLLRGELQLQFRFLGNDESERVGIHVNRGEDTKVRTILYDSKTNVRQRVVWIDGEGQQLCGQCMKVLNSASVLITPGETIELPSVCPQ